MFSDPIKYKKNGINEFFGYVPCFFVYLTKLIKIMSGI